MTRALSLSPFGFGRGVIYATAVIIAIITATIATPIPVNNLLLIHSFKNNCLNCFTLFTIIYTINETIENLMNQDIKVAFHESDIPTIGKTITAITKAIIALLFDFLSFVAGRGEACVLTCDALADCEVLFLRLPFFPPKDVEKEIPVPGMREVIRSLPVELNPMRKVFPPTEELKLFFPNVKRKGPDDLLRLNLIAILSRPYINLDITILFYIIQHLFAFV